MTKMSQESKNKNQKLPYFLFSVLTLGSWFLALPPHE